MPCLDLRHHGVLRTAAAVLLVALTGAALLAAGGHVAHVHEAPTAGYYNEQHVLASLAAVSADAPLPDTPAPGRLAPVAPTPPGAGDPVAAAAPVRSADPRAPPRA